MYNADGPDIDASLAFSLILFMHSFNALEKADEKMFTMSDPLTKQVKRMCIALLV